MFSFFFFKFPAYNSPTISGSACHPFLFFSFFFLPRPRQERQDAVTDLVDNFTENDLDFILVVGGWNSDNTQHLLEIPHLNGVRAFHVNKPDCIGADNTITHRTYQGDIVTEQLILENDTKRLVSLGVTAGASTPHAVVEDTLSNIFLLKKSLDFA